MPKLDLDTIPQRNSTTYPADFAGAVRDRWVRRLSPAAGLTDFGVSHVVLKPGAWSAQRHWHEEEDEFLVLLSGVATLADDSGETELLAGDCVAFPKNDGNGHCVINKSAVECIFVVVGKIVDGACHYPDIDLHLPAGGEWVRKDGSRI